MKIYVETLGCARNQVDSEMIMGQLKQSGFNLVYEPDQAEIILVNTCGFIEEAINESIDTVLYFAKLKDSGSCKYLIVAGCLPERFGQQMVPDLPEVDLFLGTGALAQIPAHIKNIASTGKCLFPDPNGLNFIDYATTRAFDQKTPYAYLKIADGCDKHCTYCIIPKLRGKQKSRPLQDIVEEAEMLIRHNVKELVLVAQETSFYGKDIKTGSLTDLMKRISDLSDDIWIRLMYGHPESIDENFIKTIADHKNICPYFDIPIQHASDAVLKKMGRKYTQKDLYRLFDNIRTVLPEATLRTTVITGFPGETPKDFKTLLKFIKDIQFDHLGAFTYSDFEDLPSHHLTGHISPKTAKKRYNEIMAYQKDISTVRHQRYLDKVLTVLIEETPESKLMIGRTIFQAPEVDGITYVKSPKLDIGTFAKVKITDTLEYDLIGEMA